MKYFYVLFIFACFSCLPVNTNTNRIRTKACKIDSDCSLGKFCLPNVNICVDCDNSGDHNCLDGKICQNNFCVSPNNGNDCTQECSGETPYCYNGSCVACSSQEGQTCDSGYSCVSNICIPTGSCSSDDDCTTQNLPACNPNTNQCVECTENNLTACSLSEVCAFFNCVPSITYYTLGEDCNSSNFTSDNYYCKYSGGTGSYNCKCDLPYTGTQTKWVVKSGERCSRGYASYTNHYWCIKDNYCNNYSGFYKCKPEECNTGDDCPGGLCDDNTCVDCIENSDCAYLNCSGGMTEECQDGQCFCDYQ